MKAVLGGTFDFLHVGHERLLCESKKFDSVVVGITSDAFARKLKDRPVNSYFERKRKVASYLSGLGAKFEIIEINDPFGNAVDDDSLDAIIVSEETEKTAGLINQKREGYGKKPLKIITTPIIYGEDCLRISSVRVASGLIDRAGKRAAPVKVNVGSTNESKLEGVNRALARVFSCEFHASACKAGSGIDEQPFGEDTFTGAYNRAVGAYASTCDYSIGIESGLIFHMGKFFDLAAAVVYDGETGTSGTSMGFEVPNDVVERIQAERRSFGSIVDELSGVNNIGRKEGAIAYFSNNILKRAEMNEQCVACAFIPRIYKTMVQK
ncbi:inosine/xanthosine triphosphatase [Candidatus Micrarchaeota archaeon CG08_land_8_20_14_0_20_49_17]|nr:MAG: hypothetical protein AUJ13_01865 [Candidatus Micrarchaeota archaeon CG1_02_49_24]PIU10021.1 MAG: inosine/xanthosine triphosphatase [Candidatus Micrarchaeota archaeon CG08_land_8_20_14_0_20_49_17]HII53622.1 inosine/xanthosine triphosphatase [Candidatus Micrarchaeota archaeon]